MTVLKDYSHLRRTENVEIPLNGVTYWALPDPPASVPLESLGALDPADLEVISKAAQSVAEGHGDDPVDAATLAAMSKAGAAGMQQTRRAIQMLQVVLLPESLEKFSKYMGPPHPEMTSAERADHQEHQITLPQVMAVYQDLMAYYGRRPTLPPQSSPNGLGGAGGTSTVGAPPEE